MELSPTARVILGMLGLGPRSGYDIKTFVDKSTRFFWAASYGQIYPELKRLAEAGLIEPESEAEGGRRRTIYRLTAEGERALHRWLAEPTEIQEMRDESLLKLFFSEVGGRDGIVAALRAKRDHHVDVVRQLRAVEAGIPQAECDRSIHVALRFGIAFNDFIADWCGREADRVGAAQAGQGSASAPDGAGRSEPGGRPEPPGRRRTD